MHTYTYIRYFAALGFLFLLNTTSAQNTLTDWNHKRLNHTRQTMWVLGGWAAANLTVGAIGMGRSKGENRAFHQMNLGWGAINLGLAASGIWTAAHTDPASLDVWNSLESYHKMQRIFLFNAGLDVGYVASGFWMLERAKTDPLRADRWRGFGKSIILQGAFLFVFDLGAFWYQHRLNEGLRPFLPPNSSIGLAPNGIGFRMWM